MEEEDTLPCLGVGENTPPFFVEGKYILYALLRKTIPHTCGRRIHFAVFSKRNIHTLPHALSRLKTPPPPGFVEEGDTPPGLWRKKTLIHALWRLID
jgi:hypothetical protein